ncbi:MAG TPA: hypothetical protein VFQ72_00760 [Candidatus Paceibacterota bacterium]|nr:hypothetical protein [Candidatus Paceibacterota bacterium]
MSRTTLFGIIAVIVVAAAIYIWSGKAQIARQTSLSTAVATSSSDELDSIEADLGFSDPGPDLSSLNNI